jgi:hypothetical protein
LTKPSFDRLGNIAMEAHADDFVTEPSGFAWVFFAP